MAYQRIRLKNTNVAGKVPAADQLDTAELCIQLKDKKLFSKDADGNVFAVAGANAIEEVNLGYTAAADKGTVTNDAGADAELPLATSSEAGLMSPAAFGVLDGITAIGDGTISIVDSSGGAVGSFTTNQAGNDTISLPAGFSGDYNDLTNQPTIGDGTITITKADGTPLGSFSTNQTGDDTIALPASVVPSAPGDGRLTIKDADGNVLGEFTADQATGVDTEIDLPAIPENTSDLTNDSGFITAADIGDGTITTARWR